MNKICFVVCWYGKFPSYIPIWLKCCSTNSEYDFLLITENDIEYELPKNVKCVYISRSELIHRVKERLSPKASLEVPYRLCDYRPMYGVIFESELRKYDYWGYCDVDIVLGNINSYLPYAKIYRYDAIYNGGHFSIIKNCERMNYLFKKKGSLYKYKTVIEKDAIFAFDETTGIQRIARKNDINCLFEVPYVEVDSKYKQLRSRLEELNPDHQAFYWEKGEIYRIKSEEGKLYYQKLAYVHLQKRKLEILDDSVISNEAFWITPNGFISKTQMAFPNIEEINKYNPYEGEIALKRQGAKYKKMKLKQIIKRTPYQIYVRLMQEIAGINSEDGARKEMPWIVCK